MADKPLHEKFLSYRGRLTAIASLGKSLAIVTTHPEDLGTARHGESRLPSDSRHGESRLPSTALGRLDCESLELTEESLPCGGRAIVVENGRLWIAGTDGRVYEAGGKLKAPKPLTPTFDPPPVALALLSNDRLAVLSGEAVAVVHRGRDEVLQTLAFSEPGAALASDPTGQWLAVGTQKGTVFVFECEEKDDFLLSESAKLHEGAVTAMLFEPEELRFLSAGADLKLLLTHARGKLEPEDRGRGGMHEDAVTSVVNSPGDRFLTGSRDGTCKNWTRGDRTRPSTQSDGLVAVVGLALVEIHGRPHLVAACHDDTLRFFLLDAAGKFGPPTHRLFGAMDGVKNELGQNDTRRREAALKQLAGWNDGESLTLLAERVGREGDAGLRRLAVKLLADSGHAQSAKYLQTLIDHADEAVRLIAFEGLQKIHGPRDFVPLDLVLQKSHENTAVAAVKALAAFAAEDDRAHSRLVKALEHAKRDVAQAALLALENVHGDKPDGDLLGLASKKHDAVRRLALIRLLQRRFLDRSAVVSAIRRQMESGSAEVRHAALLVLILSRPALAATLRARDADLNRQLHELETFSLDATSTTTAGEPAAAGTSPSATVTEPPAEPAKKGTKKKAAKKTDDAGATDQPPEVKGTARKKPPEVADTAPLSADDLEPLLQAAASRALDTCVAGTRYLALLRDGRALGLLLQLSREEDNAARVSVCRGLANLGDARGVPRLESFLFDKATEVRDAAFTALAAVHENEPLRAAEAGLNSGQEDVHRRALELLVRTVRKGGAEGRKQVAPQAMLGSGLLVRALNDAFPGVRKEALKSVLGLKVGGDAAGDSDGTLRFVLQSSHADVRREVLTEAIAQAKLPWAWALLLDLFHDPDASLRAEAFEFALKETKRRDLKPMAAGLRSKFADIRKTAIEELRKQHKAEALELIVGAVNDEDLETRQAALDAVVMAGARGPLVQALDSRHIDVRLKAAGTLALLGDAASYAPLIDLIRQEQPPKSDPRLNAWKLVVAKALDALSDLGDPRAIEHALPFLTSEFAELRKEAAIALTWCAREEHADLLLSKLSHDDPQVRADLALGLAVQGRPEAKPFVASAEFRTRLGIGLELIAFAALGDQAESELIRFLDHDDASIRRMALLFLLAREWKRHDGTPRRLLACLSSLMPRVRLAAAEGLRRFVDAEAFARFVVEQFNDRGEQEPWKISAETVDALADLFEFAPPWIRGRALCVLGEFKPEKQDQFDGWWRLFGGRFAEERARLAAETARRTLPAPAVSQSDLDELAFGAYVGLVREQGSAHAKKQQASQGPLILRVRQTAIARLVEMAKADAGYRAGGVPVLVQALSDPNKDVRTAAFEALGQLEFDRARLAAESIESGFEDLGVAGLNLLTSGANAADGRRVLEDAMRTRTDALALRAAELLREQGDAVAAAASALEAVHDRVRRQGIAWLAEAWEQDAAKTALRGALKSRFPEVRENAAIELARKKDGAAYAALVEMLKESTNKGQQTKLVESLVTLGDPRGAAPLLDRLEHDPTGTAPVELLLKSAGLFRLVDSAPRLLRFVEKKEWRNGAVGALVCVSGYDQPIEDVEDEQADRSWLEKQHPRHDDILARLLERLVEFGEARALGLLVPCARWAKSRAVDPALATLCALPDDDLRHAAVEAVGWRLRKRGGPHEPLTKALEHKHPTTKFLAAEALAKGKRSEGLSVLMAAVELMDDLDFRRRAVEALGELADARALDLLLRLAGEQDHALQEVAAEAIGHLGRSEKAPEIFKLLERFAKGTNDLACRAVRGLRWFNTPDGWKVVRERACSGWTLVQTAAIEVLAYDNDPATRDILLAALTQTPPLDGFWNHDVALDSARRVFGDESLEPDYALLQRPDLYDNPYYSGRALERVSAKGDPERVLALLPKTEEPVLGQLTELLLARDPLPTAAAAAVLGSPHARAAAAAAHVLGRAGDAASPLAGAVEKTLDRWIAASHERRDSLEGDAFEHDDEFQAARDCAQRLIWTAGRLGAARKTLIATTQQRVDDRAFLPLRRAAVAALGEQKPNGETRETLAALTTDVDPEVRQRAAALLAADNAKQAALLAPQLVSDRAAFHRVAKSKGVDAAAFVRESIGSSHYQGVVLPFAVANNEDQRLAETALNRDLPEPVRLGAIEALGVLATTQAEAKLSELGANTEIDEELRKASWRSLRRSKRKRVAAT